MKTATILALFLFACGDDGGSTVKDAPTDTPKTDGPMVDTPKTFMDGPPGTSPLTIRNILAWCSIKVNGGTASAASFQTFHVTPGVIPITATAASSTFKIADNMWHLTDGDTGTGETGIVTGTGLTAESAVTATVEAAMPKCIWVCCPFQDGHGCEPSATDPLDCP
jgi:hypothetical protein